MSVRAAWSAGPCADQRMPDSGAEGFMQGKSEDVETAVDACAAVNWGVRLP
jgi:hypothetical protein